METAIEFVMTGECKVNRQLAVKKWSLLCRIAKCNKEYRLIEVTPKGKTILKVTISKEDAEYLIKELGLKYVPNDFFNNYGMYLTA